MPEIIFRYIAKKNLLHLITVITLLAFVILIFDFVELLKISSTSQISSFTLLKMALLKNYSHLNKTFPFVIIVVTIMTYTSLTKSSELIVMRSYGISVWKFLSPSLFSAFFFGVLTVLIFNPIGLLSLKKYNSMEHAIIQGKAKTMNVGKNGIWLREIKEDKIIIINAIKVIQNQKKFLNASFFMTNKNYQFLERVDAKSAQLSNAGEWIIEDAIITKNDLSQHKAAKLNLPTSIQFNQIQETFLPPETISVYKMLEFIKDMQASGFSTLKHSNYFFKTLASPFLYLSMVLIAINFATANPRSGKVGISIITGMIFGFVIYLISDIINAIAISGAIPVYIAAIAPTVICLCTGIYLTIHNEDG